MIIRIISVVALLATTACRTITTVTGPIDDTDHPGEVEGQFYYLPKGMIRLKGEYIDNGNNVFQVSATSTLVADPSQRFFLSAARNDLYDDTYSLTVNDKGLLESVSITAEDKTSTIISDLASTAASSMKLGAGLGGRADVQSVTAPKPHPFDYTFTLDELPRIQQLIGDEFNITIEPEAVVGTSAAAFDFGRPAGSPVDVTQRRAGDGIVFRPVIPYRVVITDEPFQRKLANYSAVERRRADLGDKEAALEQAREAKEEVLAAQHARDQRDEAKKKLDAEVKTYLAASPNQGSASYRVRANLFLPDEHSRLLFKLGRTAFVKRTDTLTFKDGLLTKVEGTHPSPIVGFLQIPKNIVTAAAPLPLELKNTQISNIEASRKLEALQSQQR